MRVRLPAFTRNFYFATGMTFLVWMLFFDTNDFISQVKLWKNLKKQESRKEYYLQEIEKVHKERRELHSKPQLLEKFAREKYLMKRKNEEIFVVVEEGKEVEEEKSE